MLFPTDFQNVEDPVNLFVQKWTDFCAWYLANKTTPEKLWTIPGPTNKFLFLDRNQSPLKTGRFQIIKLNEPNLPWTFGQESRFPSNSWFSTLVIMHDYGYNRSLPGLTRIWPNQLELDIYVASDIYQDFPRLEHFHLKSASLLAALGHSRLPLAVAWKQSDFCFAQA